MKGDLFTYCAARFATIALIAKDRGESYIQRLAESAVEEMGQRIINGTADEPRREYHANGMYWSGVPTVDLPCDFCGRGIMYHDPRTHACSSEKASESPVWRFTVGTHVRFIDHTMDHCEWIIYRMRTGDHAPCYDMYSVDDRTFTHWAFDKDLREVFDEGDDV